MPSLLGEPGMTALTCVQLTEGVSLIPVGGHSSVASIPFWIYKTRICCKSIYSDNLGTKGLFALRKEQAQ